MATTTPIAMVITTFGKENRTTNNPFSSALINNALSSMMLPDGSSQLPITGMELRPRMQRLLVVSMARLVALAQASSTVNGTSTMLLSILEFKKARNYLPLFKRASIKQSDNFEINT
jgi:hypothetical protein